MVDPLNGTSDNINVTPVAAGALENAGIGSGTDANVPTTDLFGNTRSTTAPEIGAIELVVALINMFHNDAAFQRLGVLGFTGSYNDRMLAFFRDFFTVSNGSLTDLQARYIKANGKFI